MTLEYGNRFMQIQYGFSLHKHLLQIIRSIPFTWACEFINLGDSERFEH